MLWQENEDGSPMGPVSDASGHQYCLIAMTVQPGLLDACAVALNPIIGRCSDKSNLKLMYDLRVGVPIVR